MEQETKQGHLCIAIDGPAGAGKSTVAKALAKRLGIRHLDTGAMYRAMALAAIRSGVDPSDEPAMARLLDRTDIRVAFTKEGQRVSISGEDVTGDIRTPQISMAASLVGVHPCVRKKLVALQQQVAREYAVVMDGRDITTVVLPDTPYKFFITASPEVRAERRYKELVERGDTKATFDEVLAEIVRRDHNDTTRAYTPMLVAEDALVIDTSDMTVEQALDRMLERIREVEG